MTAQAIETIVAIDTICMTATRISENRHNEPRSRRKADMVEGFGRLVYVLGQRFTARHIARATRLLRPSTSVMVLKD